MFFTCVCRHKKTNFLTFYEKWVGFVSLQLHCNCWVVFGFNDAEKQSVTCFCSSLSKMDISRDSNQKRKDSPYLDLSRDHDKKRSLKNRQIAASKSLFNLFSLKSITCLSSQRSISTTKPHILQHEPLLEPTHLYRICKLWKLSRQVWSIFLLQKGFQILGCET